MCKEGHGGKWNEMEVLEGARIGRWINRINTKLEHLSLRGVCRHSVTSPLSQAAPLNSQAQVWKTKILQLQKLLENHQHLYLTLPQGKDGRTGIVHPGGHLWAFLTSSNISAQLSAVSKGTLGVRFWFKDKTAQNWLKSERWKMKGCRCAQVTNHLHMGTSVLRANSWIPGDCSGGFRHSLSLITNINSGKN